MTMIWKNPRFNYYLLISNCHLNFESSIVCSSRRPKRRYSESTVYFSTAICYCLLYYNYSTFQIVNLYNYKMTTHNLQIDIDGQLLGHKTFLFNVEESALDYIQQAGSNDCIPSIVEFLTNCVQQGVIQLNVEELVKDVQFTVSIPKRNINFCNLAKSVNVKDDQCSQAIDWHNISDVNEESEFENEEVDKPNKKTNATTTTVECSNETSQKIQNEKEAVHQVIFTDGMTKFMLEKYGQLMNFIGPVKKFKRKLDMWKQIAKDMEEELGVKCTHTQIENRYKTVSKRKKVIVNNNKSTGAARMDDEYENEWKQITNKDDSIIPEVMRSTKVVVINKKDITESKPKKMKTDSSQLMLLKFLKEKEDLKKGAIKKKWSS